MLLHPIRQRTQQTHRANPARNEHLPAVPRQDMLHNHARHVLDLQDALVDAHARVEDGFYQGRLDPDGVDDTIPLACMPQ
jgi:hypothetical protein